MTYRAFFISGIDIKNIGIERSIGFFGSLFFVIFRARITFKIIIYAGDMPAIGNVHIIELRVFLFFICHLIINIMININHYSCEYNASVIQARTQRVALLLLELDLILYGRHFLCSSSPLSPLSFNSELRVIVVLLEP